MATRGSKAVGIKPEVLNDLASRFLINLSEEDRKDMFKLCSQVELAHWFYLDLVRPEDTSLPACSFKEFMATIFDHCPFLVGDSKSNNLDSLIAQWKAHKYRKPVRGAIILNTDLTKCLLVQGYPASTSWGFPKGKLEQGEDDVDTAVREVYEETGFDSRELIRRDWYLDAVINDSHSRMYIIPGVSEDTTFEPKTRKEIRAIQWFSVYELPVHRKDVSTKLAVKSTNNFFLVIPFVGKLRKWISNRPEKAKKKRSISASFNTAKTLLPTPSVTKTTPTAMPRAPPSASLLATPHNPPIPYPSPHPHPHLTPHTHYTVPAPLHQLQTGQFYEGSPQYTNVYPHHIAYPGIHNHSIHVAPRQQMVLLPTPMYANRPAVKEQLTNQRGQSAGVHLSPSLSMTQFRFNRELVLAANRAPFGI